MVYRAQWACAGGLDGQVIIKGLQAGNIFFGHSILLDEQSNLSY
jgi:hypothetical protein